MQEKFSLFYIAGYFMQAFFSSGGREDPGHSRLHVDFLEVFFHFMKLWAEQVHAFIENLLLSYWEFMFLTGDGLYKWCNCITWCLCGCIQACSYLLFFSCRIEVSALHFLKLCLVCCWSCQHINWRKKNPQILFFIRNYPPKHAYMPPSSVWPILLESVLSAYPKLVLI